MLQWNFKGKTYKLNWFPIIVICSSFTVVALYQYFL